MEHNANKTIITVVGKDTVGIIAKVCTYLSENGVNVLDISQTIVSGYFNMMMIVDMTKAAKAFADWLEKSDHQEVRAFVNIQDVDMACRDCSKGNAMNILCQKLGFMHEQIYAIGDAENDIDMLRATKHGYTFHHSPATVKQYAEGCVKSVSELIDKILKRTN